MKGKYCKPESNPHMNETQNTGVVLQLEREQAIGKIAAALLPMEGLSAQ